MTPLSRCTVHCAVAVRLLAGHQAFYLRSIWFLLSSWRFWMFNSWSCLAGVVLLFTNSLRLILRCTRCEEGGGGLFGLAGQGVTKIAQEMRLLDPTSLIRNAGVEEVGRYNAIRDLLSDVHVMLGQMFCAAYIHL
eukprot:177006-Pelagomonas_calceolata.AAC.1